MPGVGNFGAAMRTLNNLNLIKVLTEKVILEKIPILGICLGMQLFMDRSEESEENGLGWIKGNVKKFSTKNDIKIPHMGWNKAKIISKNPVFLNTSEESKYYLFIHIMSDKFKENEAFITNHGQDFASAINKK